MAKPVDIRNITGTAAQDIADAIALSNPTLDQAEVQAAVAAAIAASEPIDVNVVGGSTTPFATQKQNVPGDPTITQLNALPTPNGALIRATDDVIIYANLTPAATEGFILYEGDDIRLTTVTNLDQVFVKPVKNQPVDVYAITL